MRSYGTVHTRFWVGETAREMTDTQKLLFIYLLTSPHSNPIGCYRVPTAYIESDLGWATETVRRTINETVSIGLIEYDFTLEIVFIKGFLGYNPIANPNVAKSCIQFIEAVNRKSKLFPLLVYSLKPFTERFPKGYVDGLRNGIANREPNPNPDPKPNSGGGGSAHARMPDYVRVRSRIVEWFPNLLAKDAGLIWVWLEDADVEMDILPAVDLAREQKTNPSTFSYFNPIIARSVASRKNGFNLKEIPNGHAFGGALQSNTNRDGAGKQRATWESEAQRLDAKFAAEERAQREASVAGGTE